ncbi:MAG: hypothetical protein ACR2QM_01755 [Longimicrobiales bacterium]
MTLAFTVDLYGDWKRIEAHLGDASMMGLRATPDNASTVVRQELASEGEF